MLKVVTEDSTGQRYWWFPHQTCIWVFPEIGVPPVIIDFNRIFPYEPSIWGYPHLWKPPYTYTYIYIYTYTYIYIKNFWRQSPLPYPYLTSTIMVTSALPKNMDSRLPARIGPRICQVPLKLHERNHPKWAELYVRSCRWLLNNDNMNGFTRNATGLRWGSG